MAQRLWIIQTEASNSTVGRGERQAASGKRHGDGENDDAGSEIDLLMMNDKGIYAKGLFFNLYRPRGSVPVAAEIMAVQAQVGGQEWDPAAVEFIARRWWIFKTEAGNATVGSGKRHGDGDDNDAGSKISPLLPAKTNSFHGFQPKCPL